MNNLANAYSDRIKGERADNYEQAISCYQQALSVRTRPALPVEWAKTINNLANAYQNRIKGNVSTITSKPSVIIRKLSLSERGKPCP